MALTPVLSFVEIEEGMAQAEIVYNETIRVLEALTPYPKIADVGFNNPTQISPSAVDGEVFFIDGAGAGLWAGHTRELAIFVVDRWVFIPTEQSMLGFVVRNAGINVNKMQKRTATANNDWVDL